MKTTEETATVDVARARALHDSSELPPLLSEDQQCFNESLRAGVRSMRELLHKRRKRQ